MNTPCPNEDLLQSFCEGRLTAKQRFAIEQHIDECESCRSVTGAFLTADSRAISDDGTVQMSDLPEAPTSSPTDAAPKREPGEVIDGKYQLLRPLAAGGMGAVCIAQHLRLEALRAVKFMDPRLLADTMARVRFE